MRMTYPRPALARWVLAPRNRRRCVALWLTTALVAALAVALAPAAHAGQAYTFVVTSTADTHDQNPGDGNCYDNLVRCTLRAALEEADKLYDDDSSITVTVNFNISGSGVHVITPATPLPAVKPHTVLAANTQPGYATGSPQIGLDGSVCGCAGLVVWGNASTITGFDLQRFYRAIYLVPFPKDAAIGATITGNFIGTDPTGTTARGNVIGIDDWGQFDAVIGGTSAASRNVISGNTTDVYVEPGTANAWIEGNYIGTNAAGTAALPIRAANGAIPGACAGVDVDDASYVHVGAADAGAGNVISLGTSEPANGCVAVVSGHTVQREINAIRIESSVTGVSAANSVRGNRIGTNAAGTAALGNEIGIDISDAHLTTIGGNTAGARNIISGNEFHGIWDHSRAGYTATLSNYIGTDVTGTVAVPNGNGILNVDDEALIGLSYYAQIAGNVISGNTNDGVDVQGVYTTAAATAIAGNRIGVDAAGNELGNGGDGIHVDGINGLYVGGAAIADNGGNGVTIVNAKHVSVVGSLYDNGKLGIDRGGDGVTDNVSGNGANFPVITGQWINSVNDYSEVDGTLDAAANTSYRIAVYDNTSCDPSGYGEGKRWIGDTVVKTDASGLATFALLNVEFGANDPLTATATGPAGTSEFSQCPTGALAVLGNQGTAGGSGGGGDTGTSYRWIGAADMSGGDNHSWTDPKNWVPSGVPGNGDSVFLSQPGGAYCTAHVDAVPTVSLVNFAVAGGAGTCGTWVTGGQITVSGQFSWHGGLLATPTTLSAGATGSVSGGGGLNELNAQLDVAGQLTLTGLTGTDVLQLDNPQAIHVLAGGSLTSNGNNDLTNLSCCTNPAKVINDGTLSAIGGRLSISAVELDQNAQVVTSNNGTIVSQSSPVTLGDGASYTGDGAFQILNSTARLGGTQTVGSGMTFRLGGDEANEGGTLGGQGSFTGAGHVDWAGGEIEAELTLAPGFHLDAEGPHPGNGSRALGGIDHTGASAVTVTQTNHGTITFAYGAGMTSWDAAHLVNASDGTVALGAGTTLDTGSCCLNPDTLVNSGHVQVPSAAVAQPATLNGMALQDTGGTITVAAGSLLALTGRAPGALNRTAIGGGGTLAIADPLSVSGTVNVASATTMELDTYGALDGAATIGGAGRFVWTGGYLSGSTLTVGTQAGITVGGADAKHLANTTGNAASTVVLAAPTTFAAGTSRQQPNLLDLWQDTLKLTSSTTLRNFVAINSGTLVNVGHLTADPGASGFVDRNATTRNRGRLSVKSGTLTLSAGYAQTSGTTDVAAKTELAGQYSSTPFTFTGGVLEGAGTVLGAVAVDGTKLSPGGTALGTLSIKGSLTENARTTFAVNLSSTRHDLVSVTGPANVAGKIAAANASSYRPSLRTVATILKAQSVNGSIACMTTSGGGAASGHWRVAKSSTTLKLIWVSGTATSC